MVAETLRLVLAVFLIAMYILAMLSLRCRRLSLGRFIAWGCLALFVPAVGPFLVLLLRPGTPDRGEGIKNL
jgi:hypothetical protein